MPKKAKVKEVEVEEVKKPKTKVTEEETEETSVETKKRALGLALAEIEKKYGKGSIMTIKGYRDTSPVKHISSGSLQFDLILGKGGFAFGRVVEVYGAEGAGKTSLCLEIIARAQSLGLRCAFIDKENALDPDYAEKIGVDLEKVYIAQPSSGEEALTIAEKLIMSNAVDIIVVDSVASLNPSADLEKSLDENAKMAGRASLLTRFFERNDAPIQKNGVLLLCINQMRDGLNPYGPKQTRTGGHALKHATSYMVELHPVEKIPGADGNPIGNKIRAKVVKNKLSSPYREANYNLIFGQGIDHIHDVVELATQVGVIEKSGTWMTYGEDKFQGMVGAKEFFADKDKFEALRVKVVSVVGPEWGPEGK